MIFSIFSSASSFIVSMISKSGYFGVAGLMAAQSALIPLPSEIIMPFSGYLVYLGQFNLLLLSFVAAVGCLIGANIAYWVGFYGGRPLVEKYGKYVLISHRDLDRSDRWFKKHGEATVFFSRLLPIVRTYASLPAGISRMNYLHFCIFIFLGDFIWSYALSYLGLRLGQNWLMLRDYFKRFDILIAAIIILAVGLYIWKHLKRKKLKDKG